MQNRSIISPLTGRRLAGAALAAALHVPYVAWIVAGVAGLIADIAGAKTIYGLGQLSEMNTPVAVALIFAVASALFLLFARFGEKASLFPSPQLHGVLFDDERSIGVKLRDALKLWSGRALAGVLLLMVVVLVF